MARVQFVPNKSKTTSILYFAIYAVACFVYWLLSNNHYSNDVWADIYTMSVDYPIVYTNTQDLLKSAIDQNPKNTLLHSSLEEVRKLENVTKNLEHKLRISYQQEPKNPVHLTNYGRFLFEQGRYTEAEEHLIKAIAVSSTFGEAEILLMKTYHHSGNWRQLQKLALEVSMAKTNLIIAKRYLEIAKRKISVIKILEETVKTDPSSKNHLALSKELFNRKRFSESFHHALVALQKENDLSNARLMLALAYHKLGQKQEAIKVIKPGLRFDSELQLIQQKLNSLEYSKNTALVYQ